MSVRLNLWGKEMEPCGYGVFPVKDALEIVLVFDQSGEILYANTEAEKNLGYYPECQGELCGRKISEIFPGDFKEVEGRIATNYPFGVHGKCHSGRRIFEQGGYPEKAGSGGSS